MISAATLDPSLGLKSLLPAVSGVLKASASGSTLTFAPSPAVAGVALLQVMRGPKGDAGGYYEHGQGAPASTWTVNHNLGYRPNARALSVGGVEMWAEVLHVSVNQLLIIFDSPVAGLAVCS